MPRPKHGDEPSKGKTRSMMREITLRALGGAAGRLIASGVRELFSWLPF